jgi:hypothetical protein
MKLDFNSTPFPSRIGGTGKGVLLIQKMRHLVFIPLLILFSSYRNTQNNSKEVYKADVVVYGGTSSAVTAAVQVSRMGKSVIIVSPDKHLGGMSSSGLGFTDTGNKEVIGGLAREFYQLVYQHYQKPESWKWQKQLKKLVADGQILKY